MASGTGSEAGDRGQLCRVLGGGLHRHHPGDPARCAALGCFEDQAGGPGQGAGPAQRQGTWGGFDWLHHETSAQDLAAWARMGASVGLRAAHCPGLDIDVSTRVSLTWSRPRPSASWARAATDRPGAEAPPRLPRRRAVRPDPALVQGGGQRARSPGRAARRRPAVRGRRDPRRHPAAVRVGSRPTVIGAGGLTEIDRRAPRRSSPSSRLCSSCSAAPRSSGKAPAPQQPIAAGSTRTPCAATSTRSPRSR